jgi:DNA-binding CsgD family transcriptional regulator
MHMITKELIQDVEAEEIKVQAPFIARSLRLLAGLAACQGDDAVACVLYEESLAITGELDYKRYIAACLEDLANVAATQGQPAYAARLWNMAESLRGTISITLSSADRTAYKRPVTAGSARQNHLPGQVFAVQELAPVPERVNTVPRSANTGKEQSIYPAGLTAREVEVLQLVAQGLTDAQVAECLVISPRTVNWHLTSIYSKLQVSSRCAATRYAIEHQLI